MEKNLFIIKEELGQLSEITSVRDCTLLNPFMDSTDKFATYVFTKRRNAEDFLRLSQASVNGWFHPDVRANERSYWSVCVPTNKPPFVSRWYGGENICYHPAETYLFTTKKAATEFEDARYLDYIAAKTSELKALLEGKQWTKDDGTIIVIENVRQRNYWIDCDLYENGELVNSEADAEWYASEMKSWKEVA